MASAKDTFEANTFEANTFACGTWRGIGAAAAVIAASRVVFTADAGMTLFTRQPAIAAFTNEGRQPLYGDAG